MSTETIFSIDESTFHGDVDYIESLWQRRKIGDVDMPIIDTGTGRPLIFVPILEHLEFVYARQIRAFSETRRVIMYRRHETRSRAQVIGLADRAEELRRVLDSFQLDAVDFVAHGDAAMVLFEFAVRYPQRCHSLVIVAQGADYQISPHPFIWCLHELFVRLPVEHFLPASFLRNNVINYIMAQKEQAHATITNDATTISTNGDPATLALPRHFIDEQFRKIELWPFVYKFSVLPVIHYYDMRKRLGGLTMPILLINRDNDSLSPEAKTHWLSDQLPNCVGYHIVSGKERFFMYSNADTVTRLIKAFQETL